MTNEHLEKIKHEFAEYTSNLYWLNIIIDIIDDLKEAITENQQLQQELTKYKERCEKAIEYIDNTFILTSRDYAKEISDFKIKLKAILENKE